MIKYFLRDQVELPVWNDSRAQTFHNWNKMNNRHVILNDEKEIIDGNGNGT